MSPLSVPPPQFLRSLPREQLTALVRGGTRRLFPAGTVIVTQGQVQSCVHIILSGRALVIRSHPQFVEPVVVAAHTAGSAVGEINLFDGQPQPVAAVAAVDTETLALSVDAVTSALRVAAEDWRETAMLLRWTSCAAYAACAAHGEAMAAAQETGELRSSDQEEQRQPQGV